jgi:hypothetical protein
MGVPSPAPSVAVEQTSMARKKTRTTKKAVRRPKSPAKDVLDRLQPQEAAGVLRALLGRHPELRDEAREMAASAVTQVDPESLAEDVEQALACVSEEDFQGRAGRHSWGYVSPGETAYELLDEALEPFLGDMKRLVELGLEEAAIATCLGIVLGLHSLQQVKPNTVLEWVPDFPIEMACQAVSLLIQEVRKKRGSRWRTPATFFAAVPREWKERLVRAAGRGSVGEH